MHAKHGIYDEYAGIVETRDDNYSRRQERRKAYSSYADDEDVIRISANYSQLFQLYGALTMFKYFIALK